MNLSQHHQEILLLMTKVVISKLKVLLNKSMQKQILLAGLVSQLFIVLMVQNINNLDSVFRTKHRRHS